MKPRLSAAFAAMALLAVTSAAHSRAAPPPAAAAAIPEAFKKWLTRWSVPNGSLAVMQGNTLVATYRQGTYEPEKAELVASLSKAITGICIAKLVEANRLTFETQLKTVLPAYFKAHPPKDRNFENTTIAQLLVQTSGLRYDPSQNGPIYDLPRKETNLEKQVEITFGDQKRGKQSYFYNNMNYAVLGFVIETVTGRGYEDYCKDTVLKPVGVTDAELDPEWRILSSWAGWMISPVNYTRFLDYFVPNLSPLSIPPGKWPTTSLGGGAYYSLGTLMRKAGSGYNFWHGGNFTLWGSTHNSFYTVIQDKVRYQVEYSPNSLSDKAREELDDVLHKAAVAKAARGVAEGRAELLPH